LEYAFVGPAIPYMDNFIKSKYGDCEQVLENEIGHEKLSLPKKEHFPSAKIFEYGATGKDKICQKVVDLFLSIYETAVGDFALRNLSYSGIYLTGNMTISLADYIKKTKPDFLENYKKKQEVYKWSFW